MHKIAHTPLAGAPDITLNVKTIGRAHGTTGAMITSGVALVLATVVALFLVAAGVSEISCEGRAVILFRPWLV